MTRAHTAKRPAVFGGISWQSKPMGAAPRSSVHNIAIRLGKERATCC